ncbi:MAG: hypothetical protein ACRDVW_09040, partial [Acidimicrobiales bacterium]
MSNRGVEAGASPLAVDSLAMFEVTASLPEQVRDALEMARSIGPLPVGEFDSILVLGMGGSGIAGDVLAAAAAGCSPVPVGVSKSYGLPAWVG